MFKSFLISRADGCVLLARTREKMPRRLKLGKEKARPESER
jgi:hypothetical protein